MPKYKNLESLLILSMVLIYVFTSAFLEAGPEGRVTIADLMLVVIIFVSAITIFARDSLHLPQIYTAAVPMLFVFFLGSLFAAYPDRASFELIVILFSFFGGIAIINLLLGLSEAWLKHFVKGYVVVIGLVSFLCLLDFFALPGLVSSRQLGGLQGPFRNTGQAGSFFGVHAAILIAMVVSGLVPRSSKYLGSAMLTLLALIFTLKRASTLAVVAGLLILFMVLAFSSSAKDKRLGTYALLSMAILGVIGYILFEWALDAIPGLRWRFGYKFNSNVIDTFENGFLAENINSTFAALADRPLLGVGLGNVSGVYQYHEIHSTYLGILAYGGLLGTLGYVYFMANLFQVIVVSAKRKLENVWAGFLYYLLPLLMGQMIGWGYTYHIRKREFWFLVILVVVAVEVSKRLTREANAKSIRASTFLKTTEAGYIT